MAKFDERGTGAEGYGVRPSGYRLPPETRLGPVRLQVSDLERSLDYYRRVLGLRALEQTEDCAMLGPDNAPAGRPLVELRERPGAAPVRPRSRLGLFHFAIRLPDRPALGRFVSHLAELRAPAGASDHEVSEAIYLEDPDGLGIEVYADRPRSAWRHRDGELVMGTDPLDLEDLMAAGAGGTWDGMPAGTTPGHVHLHVGGLDRAADFYHHGLGLDQTVWSYPGALFLSAGGYHHHLGLNTWAAGAPPAGEDEARLLDWTLTLPAQADVDAVAASLEMAGFAVDRVAVGDEAVGTGIPESANGFVTTDPWGTAVRVRAG